MRDGSRQTHGIVFVDNLVVMKKTKTNQQIRVVWENDIPIPVNTDNRTWGEISWKKLERIVYKLQKRIYRASQRGDIGTVHKLQKLLTKSEAAKTLAVRKVTQDNQGKNTPGVDRVKSLTPAERTRLVQKLKLTTKAKPTRRVWIPKPGKKEKRPLGIPTMHDRALQTLLKMALEPEWEAKFEPNSFGFRPGRSAQDAIKAIYNNIRFKPKYVLDADIAKCFDQISHDKLLQKLSTTPKFRKQIKFWLKAGVLDKGEYSETRMGTPQGGAISPLLANIALHGMENTLMDYIVSLPTKYPGGKKMNGKDKKASLGVIRYADDFVVIHEDINVVNKCREILEHWLSEIGLELKPEKTRLTHTFQEINNQKPGFDFLGFNIRQYFAGKKHSGKTPNKVLLGHKTIIKPSKEKIAEHYRAISKIIERGKAWRQDKLIRELNPLIRGWAQYYTSVNSAVTFEKLGHRVWIKLRAWAKSRHKKRIKSPLVNGKKRPYWVAKYWKTVGNDNWVFMAKTNGRADRLLRHYDFKIIEKYAKVAENRSPYDGDFIYWSTRMGRHPECPTTHAKLLKIQKGRCGICGHYFKTGDVWEIDHILPTSIGGRKNTGNIQLTHRHCHHSKLKSDLKRIRQAKDVMKIHSSEEPCALKGASTVLETSREGDFLA